MSKKIVGLSVSLVIRDILDGMISERSVAMIIGTTKARTSGQWDEIIKEYREIYWGKDPDRGEKICRRLINSGKIVQSRILFGRPHCIVKGHTMEAAKFSKRMSASPSKWNLDGLNDIICELS